MDRALVLKILGKKDSVDLGDMVYNLREITEYLRSLITLREAITEDIISSTVNQLNKIDKTITNIKDNFRNGESIVGYTNSKGYLSEFINDLELNTKGLLKSLEPYNKKNFVYYTNVIIDLVLDY